MGRTERPSEEEQKRLRELSLGMANYIAGYRGAGRLSIADLLNMIPLAAGMALGAIAQHIDEKEGSLFTTAMVDLLEAGIEIGRAAEVEAYILPLDQDN